MEEYFIDVEATGDEDGDENVPLLLLLLLLLQVLLEMRRSKPHRHENYTAIPVYRVVFSRTVFREFSVFSQ